MSKTNTSGLVAAGFQEMRRFWTPMDRADDAVAGINRAVSASVGTGGQTPGSGGAKCGISATHGRISIFVCTDSTCAERPRIVCPRLALRGSFFRPGV
jgi:hypothetical protein